MHHATDAETDEALVLERVLLAVVGGVGVCAINVGVRAGCTDAFEGCPFSCIPGGANAASLSV
jgi:hypothetical protein